MANPGKPPQDVTRQHTQERPDSRAGHGYSNEVRWSTGQGRQPYANQGPLEAQEPNCGDKYDSGDRGARSGTTLEQMRRVRGTPEEPPIPQKES